MQQMYKNPKLELYIGDVRNSDSIREAMVGVDFVFQAAALKQVSSCEYYPSRNDWLEAGAGRKGFCKWQIF